MALTSQVNKLTVFKPTDIQGCAVWFDAYDSTTVTLSGSNVTSWQSKGYNAIEATASGALRPTYSNYTPGNPGLYFNGANKMTTGGATYGTLGMTWITASLETVRATADAAAILATNGAGAERSVRYNVNVGDANIYTINSSVLRQLTGNNTPGIRGFRDTAASFTSHVNGTATTMNTAVTYQPAVNQGFQLGQWNIGYLTGFVFECIVYDTALSLSDYQKVEGYLAWKWGFQASLASGHPYLTNAFAPIFPRLPYTIPMTIKQTKDSVPPYFARASGQMFKPSVSVTATGGTITFANVSGIDYRIHTFTTVGTANFTLTSPASVITTVLVVAGGGAGGFDDGGGGGAGGVIYNAAFTITSGSYTVTVGNGGASNGASGGNSILSSLTAIGGGGGANGSANGSNGGSGGGLGWGVANGSTPGSGTAGQGFAGGGGTTAPNYAVGGGGGAGGVGGTGSGITPGNGGIGVSHTIAGTTYNVGGGGGGGLASQNTNGTNSTASFGGGNGAGRGANAAVAGTPNTGGGGGGANNMQATNGAFGGSGIVIIAYQYQ